jgi:hypothetical protein
LLADIISEAANEQEILTHGEYYILLYQNNVLLQDCFK